MLYKTLDDKGFCFDGEDCMAFLPKVSSSGAWDPGPWMPIITGTLMPRQNGYHLFRDEQILYQLGIGPYIYEAEYRGESVETEYAIVVRETRLLRQLNWDERAAHLFACDCAEHALSAIEEAHPNEKRPRQAIEIGRSYATGQTIRREWQRAYGAAHDFAIEIDVALRGRLFNAAYGTAQGVFPDSPGDFFAMAGVEALYYIRRHSDWPVIHTAYCIVNAVQYGYWEGKGVDPSWRYQRATQYLENRV
jgi:hypothetical protein